MAEMLVGVAGRGVVGGQRSRRDWTRKVEALGHTCLEFEFSNDKLDIFWTERLGAIVTKVFG